MRLTRTLAIAALAALSTASLGRAEARDAAAAPESADASAFDGVWEVARGPRGPRGRPPEGGPPKGFDGRRPPRLGGPGGPPPEFGDGGPFAPREGEPEGLDMGDRMVRAQMTPAGQAAFDAMDPHEHPANNCVSPGLPAIAGAPGMQEWRITDGALTIRHEYYSTTRAIPIGGSHDATAAPTHEGDDVAWFDGDTLVIETTNYTASLGGLARNAPGSDARTVTERYRLSDDGRSLVGEMTLDDPRYLTHPLTRPLRLARAEEGATVEFFPCSVEAAQDYLDD